MDNGLKNLRLVCPNCNSQLETTCRKSHQNTIDSKKIIEKLKEGKSLRRCFLETGVSDGANYNQLKKLAIDNPVL